MVFLRTRLSRWRDMNRLTFVLHARGRRADIGQKFHRVITEQLVLWSKTHNMKEKLID